MVGVAKQVSNDDITELLGDLEIPPTILVPVVCVPWGDVTYQQDLHRAANTTRCHPQDNMAIQSLRKQASLGCPNMTHTANSANLSRNFLPSHSSSLESHCI